jgi:hypothetical protein
LVGLLSLTFYYLPTLPTARLPSRSEYPAEYYWLKEQPGEVVLELPINTWGAGEASRQEVVRMLYSTLHGKRIINGYSGFTPPDWEQRVIRSHREFSQTDWFDQIRYDGIDYLLIHQPEFDQQIDLPDKQRLQFLHTLVIY